MGRRYVFLWILCICTALLCGCREKEPDAASRLVSQVDITCQEEDVQISRHYTDPQKMENVLLYLRLLKPKITPQAEASAAEGEIYHIRVRRADNTEILYWQKDHRYFAKGQEPWREIEPEQADGLYRLIRQMDSDRL